MKFSNLWRRIHDLLSEDKVKDILFKLTMLGFEEEYDEKKDNLKSYLKGRRDAFKDVLDERR
jgi:hypothetical protein